MQIRPSFFIVGAPKAGTTALHAWLDRHPQVCMSSDKEPNYFTWKEIEAQQLYYGKKNVKSESDYLNLFDCTREKKIAGEASVSYLFYPETAGRIQAFDPHALIIISLREPVARAFSHYQMDYSLGLVKENFETIWKNGPAHPLTGNHYQQYFLLSEYYEQVKRYLDIFPQEQVLILLHEELLKDPGANLKRLTVFLRIDELNGPAGLEQQNVSSAARNPLISFLYSITPVRKAMAIIAGEKFKNRIKGLFFSKSALPSLDPGFAGKMKAHYRKDLLKLKELTNLPIDHWLS